MLCNYQNVFDFVHNFCISGRLMRVRKYGNIHPTVLL